ncbi:MAG: DUF459 domain-containing protein [Planctomycetota bacterium]|jgi:lysophospholipase L1-like esterase/predicted esterase
MTPLVRTVLLLTLAVTSGACAQTAAFLEGSVEVDGTPYGYRLLPPAVIEEDRTYPLVFFLHGAGERGGDNTKQIRHFPERMVTRAMREAYPCYVLAPQCPDERFWVHIEPDNGFKTPYAPTPVAPMRGAIAAFEEVVAAHPIDRDRIYLTGLSMGGFGTWDLASRYPGVFAAAVPICGGGDPIRAARLAGLPLSVWHGGADRVVPADRSRMMVEALRSMEADVTYTELEGVGHNSWNAAYGKEGCLEWMFSKKRDPQAELAAAARLMAEAVDANEKVAFLGDSITQAGNNPGGYVDLLRAAIAAEHPEATVIPAGISGHRVPDLLKRYERDVIEKKATLVFIYIGINDVWHSQSGRGTPADAFEAGLRTLIRDFRATGADVVLATPSVIGEKPVGENSLDEMLEQYSTISRTVAREEGATLCDLRQAFRDHLVVFNTAGAGRGVLTSDGVHLNAAGNTFLATQAARALRTAVLARNAE